MDHNFEAQRRETYDTFRQSKGISLPKTAVVEFSVGPNAAGMTARELKEGYDSSYERFYRWKNIAKASLFHGTLKHRLKHFCYTSGWKKFEPLWNLVIQMRKLNVMTPLLEGVLSKVTGQGRRKAAEATATSATPRAP